jgi:hypothetical protein
VFVGAGGTGVEVAGTAVGVAVAVGGSGVAVAVGVAVAAPGGGGGGGATDVAVAVTPFAVTTAVVSCCVLFSEPLMHTFAPVTRVIPEETNPTASPTVCPLMVSVPFVAALGATRFVMMPHTTRVVVGVTVADTLFTVTTPDVNCCVLFSGPLIQTFAPFARVTPLTVNPTASPTMKPLIVSVPLAVGVAAT